MYGSAITGAVAVIAANICLRPIGKALNRGTGTADADITYLFRITARTDQEGHPRALLLHSLGGQPLLLKSLKSDDVEGTDKVDVQAILTSTGRQNLLLEQIVSLERRLSPPIIAASRDCTRVTAIRNLHEDRFQLPGCDDSGVAGLLIYTTDRKRQTPSRAGSGVSLARVH
jgi:hypothetical protein